MSKSPAKRFWSQLKKRKIAEEILNYNGACFYSLAGDVERALDCLENCLIKVGNISLEWLKHDSDMNNVRDHPRYEGIIKSFPE